MSVTLRIIIMYIPYRIEWTNLRWGIVSENSVQSIFTPNSKVLSQKKDSRRERREQWYVYYPQR